MFQIHADCRQSEKNTQRRKLSLYQSNSTYFATIICNFQVHSQTKEPDQGFSTKFQIPGLKLQVLHTKL